FPSAQVEKRILLASYRILVNQVFNLRRIFRSTCDNPQPAHHNDTIRSAAYSPRKRRLLFTIPSRVADGRVLPSNVFSFASTYHQLQDVWFEGVTTIYRHVAKVSITCEPLARIFLTDQSGPAPKAGIQLASNLHQMMRNQSMVHKAIIQFESDIVSKVRTGGLRAEEYYSPGIDGHPPYLTRTERRRFIRSYYQLWGLLELDNLQQRRSRLQSISLKQLFYLCEMSWLPNGMGPGEDVDSESGAAIYQQRVQARQALSKWILEYTESMYRRLHGQDMELIWVIAMDEGYCDSLILWDHWQNSLKEVVCGRRTKEPPYKREMHWELWKDSPNEDE
ncbi:MAG: hypothetical protein Q9180_006051, partial [Flavoplaca navasiana]